MNKEEIKEYTSQVELYAELLDIDLNSLHKSAKNQVNLLYDVGDLVSELKAEAKNAKLNLNEIEAQIEFDIRQNPENYDLPKTTESAIKSALNKDERVVKYTRHLFDIEKLAEKANNLYNSFMVRKSMIQAEVQLYVNNYWGEVSEFDMQESETEVKDEIMGKVADKYDSKRSRVKRDG